jgi:hypothetical protein
MAEDRWHSLHPNSWEVYEGTRPQRVVNNTKTEPFPSVIREHDVQDSSPLIYKIHVEKPLDDSVLSKAVQELVRNNEMLQLRFDHHQYIPMPVDDINTDAVLQICTDIDGKEIINKYNHEVLPEPGGSLRVVVNRLDDNTCDVYCLAHRSIADPRSVTLLVEDLFRLYEQFNEGMELSLRPVQKSYRDWAAQSVSVSKFPVQEKPEGNPLLLQTKMVSIEKSEAPILFENFLSANGFAEKDVFLSALAVTLTELRKGKADGDTAICFDPRDLDGQLQTTAGPMMKVCSLSQGQGEFVDSFDLLRNLHAKYISENDGVSELQKINTVINMEYYIPEPWIGRIHWVPTGFITENTSPRTNCHI